MTHDPCPMTLTDTHHLTPNTLIEEGAIFMQSIEAFKLPVWRERKDCGWALRNLRCAASLARHPMLRLHLLEGECAGGPMRALVADDGHTLHYIRNLVFQNGCRVEDKGRISSLRAPKLIDSDADIIVAGANLLLLRLYTGRGFRFVPRWVRLYLRVWDHPDVMLAGLHGPSGGALRRNVRSAKNRGFGYELTRDPGWFDEFYHRMYRPYILQRFGELAVVHSYRELRREFLRGAGLIVKKDDQPEGAAIISRRGNTLRFVQIGIMDGDEKLIKEGVGTMLYYYATLLAYSQGCTRVDFGHSRAFASDGVLRYKLKWGMDVLDDDDDVGVFAISAPGITRQAQQFLSSVYHRETWDGRPSFQKVLG
ncbi:MAG: GNAT family N-acetyltransferase [Armatimonadetes bacterium]|nr:GNAT family N-acetyltransferase [Armatimonadota bacterium]